MIARFHNIIVHILVVITVATALFIGWTGWLQVDYPYDGFDWSSLTGEVESVDKNGPAFALIGTVDRIIAVDERSVPISTSLYTGKQPGDVVILTIARQVNVLSVPIVLTPPPWNIRLIRLLPILVSFGFLAIGTYVFSYQTHDVKSRLFLLVCLVSSIALASGSLSTTGPPLANLLFSISMCWLIPLIVSFHLFFPKPNHSIKLRFMSGLLLSIATMVSVWQVLVDPLDRSMNATQAGLYTFHRIWLVIGLILVVYLLLRAYRFENPGAARQQVGIVTLGGSITALMFLGFVLLPDTYLGKPLLPYNVSFVLLLLIPLSYTYAIVYFHLIPLDSHVSRMISSSLTLVLLLGIFLLLTITIVRILPAEAWKEPLILTTIMMGVILLGIPLKGSIQSIVDRLFYGRSYDLRTKIQKVSQLLQEPAGYSNFRQELICELVRTMQLECACIYLHDGEEGFTAGRFSGNCRKEFSEKKVLDHQNVIIQDILGRRAPVPVQGLCKELGFGAGSQSGPAFLACEQAHLLIPLHGSRGLTGFMLTGAKTGRGDVSKEEQEILQVISWQAGIALENIHMAAELKQRNLECIRLNHQVLLAGETERKRLAWELHDQTIQSLAGIGYGLAELRYHLNVEGQEMLNGIQDSVFGIINDLRQLYSDLRPPLLDTMGLVAAIRSLVRNYNKESLYRVTLSVNGEEEEGLTEDVAICIYRILQETLRNAQKYSHARLLEVQLNLEPGRIYLCIEDDGVGFCVPKNLGQFSFQGHYGLMGIKERVEMLSGSLIVQSAPDRGTRIAIDIPINCEEQGPILEHQGDNDAD